MTESCRAFEFFWYEGGERKTVVTLGETLDVAEKALFAMYGVKDYEDVSSVVAEKEGESK